MTCTALTGAQDTRGMGLHHGTGAVVVGHATLALPVQSRSVRPSSAPFRSAPILMGRQNPNRPGSAVVIGGRQMIAKRATRAVTTNGQIVRNNCSMGTPPTAETM